MLAVGDKAPEFSGLDQDGQPISSADLAGRTIVLYFYPKDATPGCTTEAQGFRDAHAALTELGAAVVGVSRDDAPSHARFASAQNLPFKLLADTDEAVCRAYDVIGEKTRCGKTSIGLIRTTYLIDREGLIRAVWPDVKVKGHVDEVLAKVREVSA